MRIIGAAEVRARLSYDLCIPAVRAAMIAVSRGETRQHLRSVLPLADGKLLGVMPGALPVGDVFGAKLVSVSHSTDPGAPPSHQGVVVLFDGETGAPICVLDGGEITAIRTAAASAVATDALARPDASRLAILGAGVQALAHTRALRRVRRLSEVRLWARDRAKAVAVATKLEAELHLPTIPFPTVADAVDGADLICTVTASLEPILRSEWVAPGTHLNVVGSSLAGPREIDVALVARSRYIADSREGALAQGAEFLHARTAGLVRDDHIVGEIGAILAGQLVGRQAADEVTLYKSLGHIAQDLAAARLLYATAG